MEKRTVSKWALRHWWGDRCWWCCRMVAVRFAHLSAGAFAKWMSAAPENAIEAKMSALAYISVREDGQTQVTLEQVMARSGMLVRMSTVVPGVLNSEHFEVVPLSELAEGSMNPVSAQLEVLQISINGIRRLVVRWPVPRQIGGPAQSGLHDVDMSPHVRSDGVSDWKLLERFASQAPARSREVAGTGVAASPRLQKGASSMSLESLAGPASARAAQASSAAAGDDGLYEYPKTRLGRNVKKCVEKAESTLATTLTAEWNNLNENSLRGQQRTCAGLEKELTVAESPSLVQRNEHAEKIWEVLIKVTVSRRALVKSLETNNYIKFYQPLQDLAALVEKVFGTGRRFDPELLVIQVGLVRLRVGGVSLGRMGLKLKSLW